MKSEAIVTTLEFGKNHFNAIILCNQLKMISGKGNIITIPGDAQKTPEKTNRILNQLIEFFKLG